MSNKDVQQRCPPHVYVERPFLPMLFAFGAGLLAPLYVHAHLFVACLHVSICADAVLLYVGWVLFIRQSG